MAFEDQEFSGTYLTRAIEASLRRLRTDYIDIFQIHNPPPHVIEAGEFVRVLDKACAAGKIRWYGVSCRRAEDAWLCLRWPSISCVQIPINLLEFSAALPLLEAANSHGIAIICRQPFASGELLRAGVPPASATARHPYSALIKRTASDGSAYTEAQIALRFALSLQGVSVVIAGMRQAAHLYENLRAAECATEEGEALHLGAAVLNNAGRAGAV